MLVTIQSESICVQVSSRGAELMSLKRNGVEYLWQGDAYWWSGHAPVLFPIVGMLRSERTEIGGKNYSIQRHGFARSSEFEVYAKGEDYVAFLLRASQETKKQYPFDFLFYVTYRVENDTLKTEFKTENKGRSPMLFSLGGHPAFCVPQDSAEQFEDWVLEFDQPETADCPTVSMASGLIDFEKRKRILNDSAVLPMKHSLFDFDALIFDSLKSSKVKLRGTKSGRGVEMDFSGFPMLGVWSAVNDAPFVALEPWWGCATSYEEDDCFRHKRKMRMLSAGQDMTDSFSIRLF